MNFGSSVSEIEEFVQLKTKHPLQNIGKECQLINNKINNKGCTNKVVIQEVRYTVTMKFIQHGHDILAFSGRLAIVLMREFFPPIF